jgi:hypothetical protein
MREEREEGGNRSYQLGKPFKWCTGGDKMGSFDTAQAISPVTTPKVPSAAILPQMINSAASEMGKDEGREVSSTVPDPSKTVLNENPLSSKDTFFELSCLIEGDHSVFDVNIPRKSKVTALNSKKLGHQEGPPPRYLCSCRRLRPALLAFSFSYNLAIVRAQGEERVRKRARWRLPGER